MVIENKESDTPESLCNCKTSTSFAKKVILDVIFSEVQVDKKIWPQEVLKAVLKLYERMSRHG